MLEQNLSRHIEEVAIDEPNEVVHLIRPLAGNGVAERLVAGGRGPSRDRPRSGRGSGVDDSGDGGVE